MSLQRDRPAGEGRQVDALQRRQIGAEPVEQRAHRGFVGGVGGDRAPGSCPAAARRCGQLVAAASRGCGTPRRRCFAPMLGELPDQVRTDVAGRADDQLAACRRPASTGDVAGRIAPLQSRHVARARPGRRPGLRRRPLRASPTTYRAASSRGHRFVDIDDGAPDFGVLQRQRAAQAPQHRVRGVGAIAFGDGLGVAGQQEQLRAAPHRGHRRGQPAHRVEQPIGRLDIERIAGDRGRVQHVVDAAERRRSAPTARRRRRGAAPSIAADPPSRRADLGARSRVADHQPRRRSTLRRSSATAGRPGQLAGPVGGHAPAVRSLRRDAVVCNGFL